jgi:DNA (cytosine-5)-methyltransferase 1
MAVPSGRVLDLAYMPPSLPHIPVGESDPSQGKLDLIAEVAPLLLGDTLPRGLDLFAGIGGFSAGFAELGFSMTGVDSEALAGLVYESAGFGTARQGDLGSVNVTMDVPLVVGGPPCRPWSAVNLQRRRASHQDHGLFARFIDHVLAIKPIIFVMENVPALGSDETYHTGMKELRFSRYDIAAHILHYERFGAATKRRRLFTVGVRDSRAGAARFFRLLKAHHAPIRTVRDAIFRFRDLGRGDFPDHDWSELRSIENYRARYASGQYGWRKLEYDVPAPSFGSVAKTYILHPDSGTDGFPERVLSVREVMAIMGFSDAVRFPPKIARARRYQMVANSVSPQVSRAVAATVLSMLTGRSNTSG